MIIDVILYKIYLPLTHQLLDLFFVVLAILHISSGLFRLENHVLEEWTNCAFCSWWRIWARMGSIHGENPFLISLLSLPSKADRGYGKKQWLSLFTSNAKTLLFQVSLWSEPFIDTFVMWWRDSSCGNFISSNNFHSQVADSNNST